MPPSDAGTTRIQLCGRLKAEVAGKHVTPALRGRQGRILLAYLVLNRGRPVSRDELMAAIWPQSPPVDPAAALRTQLSRLRSALGPKALAGRDAVELHLPEDTWIDIEAADRAIAAAGAEVKAGNWKDAWAQAHIALNISGRPFLAGFEAPWVEEVRGDLDELQLRAREVIARAGIAVGGSELAGAERAARAMIRSAPFRESGYLHLMQALVASGNTAEALRTYDELRTLLAEELGSAPGAEIQALHRSLLSGRTLPVPVTPGRESPRAPETEAAPGGAEGPLPAWLVSSRHGPFVGRSRELSALEALWREASQERVPRIALVEGEPGAGKTRLATELAQRVHRLGGGVLYGRADEEGGGAYEPFVGALRHWATGASDADLRRHLGAGTGLIASLVGEVGDRLAVEPEPAERLTPERIFEAVVSTLGSISRGQPTLLIVDDLHWAEPGTLMMLRHIARSPQRSGLMLLATYRPTEISEALSESLADLGRERLFERIRLGGLAPAQVSVLLASTAGVRPDPEISAAIAAETGGNPFLVAAFAPRVIGADAALAGSRSARSVLYEDGVPELVAEAVAHRAAALGPGAGPLLGVAAVLGDRFDADLLAEVEGGGDARLHEALEGAVAAGLLDEVKGTSDRFSFHHPVYRQALYESVPRARRTSLHRRAAEVLEGRARPDPGEISMLARHYAGAGPGAAAQAVEYGVRAGASALGALAFDRAIEHYGDALEALRRAGRGDESLRCELLLALGEAQGRAGRPEASRDTFSAAARIARSLGDADVPARAALGFCGLGAADPGRRSSDAVRLLESALAADSVPAPMRARLLSRLAEVLRRMGQGASAEPISLEAVELAERSGDPDTLAAALIGRWHASPAPEQRPARAEAASRIASLLERLGDRDVELQARFLEVLARLEAGEFAELDIAIAAHARLAEQLRQPGALMQARAMIAMRALMGGQFADAEREITRVLELGSVARTGRGVEYSGLELSLLRLEQGRLREMEEPLRNLIARFEAPIWHALLALVLLGEDRVGEARAELERALAIGWDDPSTADSLATGALATPAAVAFADRETIAWLRERLGPHRAAVAVGGEAAVFLGPVSHHLGALAAAEGDHATAIELLAEAVAVNERAGALPWLARSRYELARSLAARGKAGDAKRATSLLSDAERTAEELGMADLLGQIREPVAERPARRAR
ncbi:MAG: BTAD domain-containing putative transcriptional regulator [Solirubrobacterales bacterium]